MSHGTPPTPDEITRVRAWIAQQECGAHGHDFRIVVNGKGIPCNLFCERCTKGWIVGEEYGPTAGNPREAMSPGETPGLPTEPGARPRDPSL